MSVRLPSSLFRLPCPRSVAQRLQRTACQASSTADPATLAASATAYVAASVVVPLLLHDDHGLLLRVHLKGRLIKWRVERNDRSTHCLSLAVEALGRASLGRTVVGVGRGLRVCVRFMSA